MSLLRAITTVGGFTMLSRIFGFVRDILVAALLGAGPLADAFFVAFKLPNLFRRLFAEGAFNAAFVPQFAGLLEDDGRARAQVFAEQALAILLWSLLVFTMLVEIAMPVILLGFAPGFADDPEQFNRTVDLTRLTFPYLLFISLVSLMAGVLNSLGKFAAAAATPILLNICLIGAILWLTPFVPSPAHALAWGVCGAGAVQFVWLLVHCVRAGVPLRLRLPKLTDDVKTMLKRIAPVAIGAGVYQISLLIDTVIASLLPSGSISYLFYADRVNQLPMGVVGVAVGTALLPLLSRQVRAGDEAGADNSMNRALEFSLFLGVPAATALIVLAQPIIAVLFQRGEFGPDQAVATAGALAIYAAGIPAYVMVKGLSAGFFAREDTATPVKVGLVAVAVNLVLNLILMKPFLHLGIAAATAAAAWLNVILLAVILYRRGHFRPDERLMSRLKRILLASVIMAAALIYGIRPMGEILSGDELTRAGGLAVLVVLGLVVYGLLALVLRTVSPNHIRRLMNRRAADT